MNKKVLQVIKNGKIAEKWGNETSFLFESTQKTLVV